MNTFINYPYNIYRMPLFFHTKSNNVGSPSFILNLLWKFCNAKASHIKFITAHQVKRVMKIFDPKWLYWDTITDNKIFISF